jgi:hypothetical protein
MSGSWRTGSLVAEHNHRILQECDHPFKIFIHTWVENIATYRTPLESVYAHRWHFSKREPVFETPEPLIQESLVLSHYPKSIISIESFDADAFYREFHFTDIHKATKKYLNACAMYYGMQQCKSLLEADVDYSKFDYFLRIRPDFLLSEEALSQVFCSPLVFIGQSIKNEKGHVSDQCFGGEIKHALDIMGGIEKLRPVIRNGGVVFPDEVAVSGENVLMEHINEHECLAEIHPIFVSEDSPYNKIQRPKIIENLERSTVYWIFACCAHNLGVFVSLVRGYSQIIRNRFSNYFANSN